MLCDKKKKKKKNSKQKLIMMIVEKECLLKSTERVDASSCKTYIYCSRQRWHHTNKSNQIKKKISTSKNRNSEKIIM